MYSQVLSIKSAVVLSVLNATKCVCVCVRERERERERERSIDVTLDKIYRR